MTEPKPIQIDPKRVREHLLSLPWYEVRLEAGAAFAYVCPLCQAMVSTARSDAREQHARWHENERAAIVAASLGLGGLLR